MLSTAFIPENAKASYLVAQTFQVRKTNRLHFFVPEKLTTGRLNIEQGAGRLKINRPFFSLCRTGTQYEGRRHCYHIIRLRQVPTIAPKKNPTADLDSFAHRTDCCRGSLISIHLALLYVLNKSYLLLPL